MKQINNKSFKKNITLANGIIGGIVLFTVMMRFLPHIPNFVPITALALFAGSYFKKPWAYILPVIVMVATDVFLGFHSTMFFVYVSLLLAVVIGQIIKKGRSPLSIMLGTLSGSLLFFLITNFGVWLTTNWYTSDFAGLIKCYEMAIPFFRNSFAGDIFYVTIFFGSYEAIIYLISKERRELVTGNIKSRKF